ncbi:MAG: hypothetical protein H0U67_01760 [Gemmatimonadetes bacterium]|nr:hypothetical protein [Gemmatimonadota bacterium]MBA4159171.1 hypothetical protein [Gemmatimonadota bacterium]
MRKFIRGTRQGARRCAVRVVRLLTLVRWRARMWIQRVEDSRRYAAVAAVALGFGANFYSGVVLGAFDPYVAAAREAGFLHFEAVLTTALLALAVVSAGACGIGAAYYANRLLKDAT